MKYPPELSNVPETSMVPLKNIDYQIEIMNSIASTTLIQEYENPSDKFLEVEYSFPINPNSSVYMFVA